MAKIKRNSTRKTGNRIPFTVRNINQLEILNELSEIKNVSRNQIIEEIVNLGLPIYMDKYEITGIKNFASQNFDLSINDADNFSDLSQNSEEQLTEESKKKFISLEEIYKTFIEELNKLSNKMNSLEEKNDGIINEVLRAKHLQNEAYKNVESSNKKLYEKMEEIKLQIRGVEEQNSDEQITLKSIQQIASYNANFVTLMAKSNAAGRKVPFSEETQQNYAKKIMEPFGTIYNNDKKKLEEQIKIRRKNESGEL